MLEVGSDADGTWLVTRTVPGRSGVDPAWVGRPAVAARAVGAGLRHLHDTLPVAGCPWTWSVEDRIAVLPPGRADAARSLGPAPDVDRLVVCHGDPCMPNTLLDDDGLPAAHVDLGRLGVADRWADLAVAAANTDLNYGPGYAHLVLEGYGIAPDPARAAFYQALWDLG